LRIPINFGCCTSPLLRPDQLAARSQLDEVMRFPVAEAGALIGGLIVNRLPGVMSDVNGPIREP
jgi:hypothetical protein